MGGFGDFFHFLEHLLDDLGLGSLFDLISDLLGSFGGGGGVF
jgi:hypothetical protein